MSKQDLTEIFKERLVSLERGFEQKIAELSLIKELGDALKRTALSSWSELFLQQLDIIKQHTGIYSISVMLVDEETDNLYVVSASGMRGAPSCTPIRLKRGEGIAGKVVETAKTLYIPDVTKDENFSDRGTRQNGSLACVPIISEANCVGVMNFRDNVAEAFSTEDLRLFALIADQLSITTSLVRTYQELLGLEKKRMNLSRYFSRGLAEHLMADERMTRLGGDMQVVSVVFADVTGFTTMVDKHPVEDVVSVLNHFFETAVPIIFKHGGMLDKFLGDGIMAVFGIPDRDQLDPVKAASCAVDMQRAMRELQHKLRVDGLPPATVGIGIATGVALAGNIGTEEQMNFTVIGEPVNLAQRLEATSKPGEIVVCEQTAERILDYDGVGLKLESMGDIRVKGINRDIHPMRIIYNP